MPTYTVNLADEEAYQKLRSSLAGKGCSIASEEPPKRFTAKQGSLWGITPKTAKKTVKITLQQANGKTVVEYSSKLASDWVNITVVGCVLAAVLAAVCVWMALDLEAFLVSGNPGFWAWLVTARGHVEFQAGEALVNLAWGLTIFLSVVIVLEAAVYIYARQKIEAFAQEVLSELS